MKTKIRDFLIGVLVMLIVNITMAGASFGILSHALASAADWPAFIFSVAIVIHWPSLMLLPLGNILPEVALLPFATVLSATINVYIYRGVRSMHCFRWQRP